MLRVFEDPDDRLDSVVQINCLANRHAGVIVGHAPPRGVPEALPQDLLVALGHCRDAHRWPRTAAPAWRLARAWMAGFEIRHLVIYGAWRTTDDLAGILLDLVSNDGMDVSLVNLATMRDSLPFALAAVAVEPVSVLIDESTIHARNTEPIVTSPARLPEGLPPLPASDVTCFKADCKGSIEAQELWFRFREAFDVLTDSAFMELDGVDHQDRVLELLEDDLRRARNGNDLLALTRAFQIAALRAGWHVRIPLRDVAVAIAMALNTAPANQLDWPLPSDATPQPQALAALAWATRRSPADLSRIRIGDFDTHCATFGEDEIPAALRPVIRTQMWVRRRQGGADHDPFFSTRNGAALRAPAIRAALDATAPTAFNAAELGTSTVRHELAALVDITRVGLEVDDVALTDETSRSLLPSADYWDWALSHGGGALQDRTGLPDPGSADVLARRAHGFAMAKAAATGFSNPPAWPSSFRSATFRERRVDEYLAADGARLHSVLLQTGGGADRLSLIRGLRWSAERLHAAEVTLREELTRTAEILAATLDGRLELRVRSDAETTPAVERILKRADRDHGLSPAGARLLFELLEGPRGGLAIGELRMHPEVARAAITELRRRQLIRVERQALVALAGGVRSNLWGWEREVMRGTEWDEYTAEGLPAGHARVT